MLNYYSYWFLVTLTHLKRFFIHIGPLIPMTLFCTSRFFIRFQNLMNWVHYYYSILLSYFIYLWSQAKKRSWLHLTAFIPRFSEVKVLFQRIVCHDFWVIFTWKVKKLPDRWYVNLSAPVIKFILPQDSVELSVMWNLNIEPSGVFSVAEQIVITGSHLFVFNSKSLLVFVFSVWNAWNSSL